ncbi:MAG: tetratricopeptide repeat protein [Pyrinomonadaceae bacterium]|nr:tetratricopeptide repeat protein [Pyrinomonadaceae bacterium]
MRFRIWLLVALATIFATTGASASSADTWTTVRSDNFHLIGNAPSSEIGEVAVRMEQFREAFGRLFPKIALQETVDTKVIVFRDVASFKPFLPKRPDGTPDEGIGGYFLTSESANYIALTTAHGKQTTYETIFHEYVHHLLNNNFDRSDIPPWLNEGLAEYYSTMEVKDREVLLGNLRQDHLYYLKRSELIPLKDFFAVDNYSLHKNGDHSRTIFYAQAWALIHYLASKNRLSNLSVLISASQSGEDSEKVFRRAFGVDFGEMELILGNYVKQKRFDRLIADIKVKPVTEHRLSISDLPEASALADLGSLLFHHGELVGAEKYLKQSLAKNPDQPIANTSMGLLRLKQGKYDLAESFLKRAVASDAKDYYVYYSYAFVLSRSTMDDNGFVMGYPPQTAKRIRDAIGTAIKLRPEFVPSYNLLAFVNLATGEDLAGAASQLRRVLKLQPGNETAYLTLAQVYLRLKRFDEAERIATSIYNSTASPEQRATAQSVLDNLKRFRDIEARNERARNARRGDSDFGFTIVRNDLTEKEIERIAAEREISVMNRSLIETVTGERRILGYIRSVRCNGRKITYMIEGKDGREITLRSDGFQNLKLRSLSKDTAGINFECGSGFSEVLAVLNYTSSGLVKAISFVPDRFRFKSEDEIKKDTRVVILKSSNEANKGTPIEVRDIPANETRAQAAERQRRNEIMKTELTLRTPKRGESRALGEIREVSCDGSGMYFGFETESGTLRFETSNAQGIEIMVFGRNAGGIKLGCGLEPPTGSVVLTYKTTAKGGFDGTVVYIEFVPDGVSID